MQELLRANIKGENIELVSLDDVGMTEEIEENGETFEENALIKAKAGADFSGLITVADDSGLSVDALGGEPGVYSARYADDESEGHDDLANNRKVLRKMEGVENRAGAFVCAMACVFPDGAPVTGEPIVVIGRVDGEILETPIGENGFGYDPLFWYPPFGKGFAQLSAEEKNSVSHRGKAAKKLAIALNNRISGEKKKSPEKKKTTEITSKQRAYLRGLASNEPAIMQIGKDGITENLVKTVSDALEARELVKLSVLEACGLTEREAVSALAEACGAIPVCTIGRKIVLYRESEKHRKINL